MAFKNIGEVVLKGERMQVVQGWYVGKRIAYQIICSNGEPFMKVTVNLPDAEYKLHKGEFCVKTWSENEPYVADLLRSGLFVDTGKRVPSGFCEASVWKLADRPPVRAKEVIIRGDSATRQVWINGKLLDPKRSQKIFNHSPDGFNWGYGGSGPAQLALAILLELVDKSTSVSWHQDFKFGFVARLPQGEHFEAKIPDAWASRIQMAREARPA
jgi:hypothetical protein